MSNGQLHAFELHGLAEDHHIVKLFAAKMHDGTRIVAQHLRRKVIAYVATAPLTSDDDAEIAKALDSAAHADPANVKGSGQLRFRRKAATRRPAPIQQLCADLIINFIYNVLFLNGFYAQDRCPVEC